MFENMLGTSISPRALVLIIGDLRPCLPLAIQSLLRDWREATGMAWHAVVKSRHAITSIIPHTAVNSSARCCAWYCNATPTFSASEPQVGNAYAE